MGALKEMAAAGVVTPEDLGLIARGRGVTPDDLDKHVHDAANVVAARVNNGGVEAQVDYLCSAYTISAAAQIVESIGTDDDRADAAVRMINDAITRPDLDEKNTLRVIRSIVLEYLGITG